jgi:hypothetical protein
MFKTFGPQRPNHNVNNNHLPYNIRSNRTGVFRQKTNDNNNNNSYNNFHNDDKKSFSNDFDSLGFFRLLKNPQNQVIFSIQNDDDSKKEELEKNFFQHKNLLDKISEQNGMLVSNNQILENSLSTENLNGYRSAIEVYDQVFNENLGNLRLQNPFGLRALLNAIIERNENVLNLQNVYLEQIENQNQIEN